MAADRQNRAGQQTRRALLDAGSRLFTQRGLADLPAAEIAREAGAFPSQVTYYFGSKEAPFVEAACRGVLRAAAQAERAGASKRSPRSYVRAVVHTALNSPALLSFVQAAVLVRGREELAPRVRETFEPLQHRRPTARSPRTSPRAGGRSAPSPPQRRAASGRDPRRRARGRHPQHAVRAGERGGRGGSRAEPVS